MKTLALAACAAAAVVLAATGVQSAPFLDDQAPLIQPRYVSGLTAPSAYTYSWAVDGYRLALDTQGIKSYLTRSTISKDATRTTQNHVNSCVARCEKTASCAMAHLIKFVNFAEGNVICALYSATAPKSATQYTTGLWNGPGTVKSSYAFTRNAGQVRASTTSKSTTSTKASSSASPSSTSGKASYSAAYDQWVWVDVPGTTCADGSQTGMAVNLHSGSTELVIGYQGGGSCYDYQTCYVQRRAYNMANGFNNATFWSQNQPDTLKWWFPFARDNQYNPWQTANYAWIPYCTGDFHAGDNVVKYSGASTTTSHKGWNNAKLDMAKLKQMLPGIKRVWSSGSSAGAFASILQYQNTQDAFGVRVDLLADSGETPLSLLVHPSQNIQVPNKSRCPNCDDSNFDSYIVGLAQANTGSRFASMSWSNDTIIPVNQGVSFDDFSKELIRLFNQENKETTNARNFMVHGSDHMLLYTTQYNAADGYTQATFLNKFKTDDPGWSSH
ncbi:hypothetical protein EX895_003613 [Sporisorium graminicola]|uniref:Uncharacterized protein n=1 Tax=Sporisorium graminicola TaxID=280036 RepID=A0A4V6ETR4_9BASI|nr:hypothetical protein EX895_003613 [Sporisorium graminicola]TKY87599.1 hypothetical protein EX895_003613 [Sporisorium graminicola]